MKRTSAVALVLVSLTALLLATTQYGGAQYSGTVTINADRTVDPADAPIQRVGDTYTLTGDVGGISVQRSNMILDGNGHTLPGIVSSIDSLGNNVTIKNSGGVYLKNVENVMVKNLIIKDCQIGIYLEQCSNVTVSANTITGTYVSIPEMQATGGIYVWGGSSHIISGNHIANNLGGIYLGYGTEHNIIVDNNITGNTLGGISIWESPNNTIYRNRFINNTIQAKDVAVNYSYWNTTSFNIWDNGSQGNYWSDYSGKDADGDGIGDTPYVIDENNKDHYPLMEPFTTPKFPDGENPSAAATWIAVSAVAAGFGAAALFYFKKKRQKTQNDTELP